MEQEPDYLKEYRAEKERDFQRTVWVKLQEAKTAMKKWPAFSERLYGSTGPLNGQDLVDLVTISTKAKYRPQLYLLPGPFIDPALLHQKLVTLIEDPRVEFADIGSIWSLFDMYVECAILDNILNLLFPKKVNRKASNKYHAYFREALGMEQKSRKRGTLNLIPGVNLPELLNLIWRPWQKAMKEMGNEEPGFTEQDMKLMMENYIAGNHIKLRKQLFPLLYGFIILKKEVEGAGRFGEPNDIKKVLLFEPLSVIIPDKVFWSKEEFKNKFGKAARPIYGGNYSHYQRYKVEAIIGI